MTKINNNLEHIKNLEIDYNPYENVNKSIISKCIIDNISIKIKTFTTLDGKNVIVNDAILDYFKNNNINMHKIVFDDLIKCNLYKNDDYILLNDLLKDAKDGITLYIEILDKSKKNIKEKEMINLISTFGVNAIISSSVKKVLKFIKKKAPYIIRGYKFESFDDDSLKLSRKQINKIKKVKIPFGIKPDFIEYDINCMPNDKINGMPIISYLIDTDAKRNKAIFYSLAFISKHNYIN